MQSPSIEITPDAAHISQQSKPWIFNLICNNRTLLQYSITDKPETQKWFGGSNTVWTLHEINGTSRH
jgi:hypothetical protein